MSVNIQTKDYTPLPIAGSTEVIDDLYNDSKTAALSANQGRILNKEIDIRIKDYAVNGYYSDYYVCQIGEGFTLYLHYQDYNLLSLENTLTPDMMNGSYLKGSWGPNIEIDKMTPMFIVFPDEKRFESIQVDFWDTETDYVNVANLTRKTIKDAIPTQLSELSEDDNHRLVNTNELKKIHETNIFNGSEDITVNFDSYESYPSRDVTNIYTFLLTEDTKNTIVSSKARIDEYEQSGFLTLNMFSLKMEQGDINNSTGADDNVGSNQHIRSIGYLELKPNTTYALSYNHTISGNGTFKAMAYKADKTFIRRWNDSSKANQFVFTTDNDFKYLRFGVYDSNGISINEDLQIQLTESDSVLPYVPYAMSNTELTKIVEDTLNGGYISRNLLNYIGYGTINTDDGKTITYNANVKYSNYMRVGSNKVVFSIDGVASNWRCFEYDANYNYISGSGAIVRSGVYTTSANCVYIRTQTSATSVNPQVNFGSNPLPYSDFVPSNTELNESLTGIIEDLTQYEQSGFLSRNLFDATKALVGTSWNLDKVATRTIVNVSVEPNTKYTISRDNLTGYSATRIFEKTSENEKTSINETVSISNMVLTTSANTHCLTFLFVVDSGVIDVAKILSNKIQVEKGEVAHSYIEYIKSNTELTQELTQIYDDGFASRNLAYKQLKGYYLSGSGVVTANATYNLFIAKVEPSKTYIITSDETSYYYSLFANEPQPSSIAIDNARHSGNRTVTIPSGANYIGFLAKNEFGMIEQGTQATPYTPYAKSNVELTQIVDGAISNNYIITNLIDGMTLGRWISSSGSESSDSTGAISNLIEIEPSTQYTLSAYKGNYNLSNIGVVWYTNTKAFIERNLRNISDSAFHTFTSPSNAKYMVVITSNASGAFTQAELNDIELKAIKGGKYIPSNTELQNNKQDNLAPGENIDIINNIISSPITKTTNGIAYGSIDANISDIHLYGSAHKSKNIFKPDTITTEYSGVTIKHNGDGTFTLNGTATGNINLILGGLTIPVPPFSGNAKLCGLPTGAPDNTYISIQQKDDSGLSGIATNGSKLVADVPNTYSGKIKYIYFWAASGVVFNNFTIKPMLSLDENISYDGYEPYGIIKPSGDIKTRNDNILNSSVNNIVFNANTQSTIEIEKLRLTAGTYVFSCLQENDMSSNIRNTIKVYVKGVGDTYEKADVNYHLSRGIHYVIINIEYETDVSFSLWVHTPNTDVSYSNFMLSRGSDIKDYVKPNKSIVHINRPLLSVNDIKNELIVNKDGTGKFIQRVDSVDLGSISWNSASNKWYTDSLWGKAKGSSVGTIVSNLLCDNYEVLPLNTVLNSTTQCIGMAITGDVKTQQRMWCNTLSTSEKPNGELFYELDTPIETELSKAEITKILNLQTFKNTTYLDTDGIEYNLSYYVNNNGEVISDIKDKLRFANYSNNYVDNAVDGNIRSIALTGESHKSKNLLNYPIETKTIGTTTFIVNQDKSVTVNGDSGNNYNIASLSLDAGSYIVSGGKQGVFVWISGKGGSNDNEYTLTLTEKTTVQVILFVNNGTTASNVTVYPMIRKSNITDNTYEPYGIIKPSGNIKTNTKNLFSAKDWNLIPSSYANVVIFSDSEIQCNNNLSIIRTRLFEIPSDIRGKNLIISLNMESSTSDGVARIQLFNSSGNMVTQTSNFKAGKVSIMCPDTMDVRYVSFTGGSGNTDVITFKNIQVEYGDTATSFVKYGRSNIYTNRPLLSVGDIKNELIVNSDGSGQFIERIASVDLGILSWTYSSNIFYGKPNGMAKGTKNILSELYNVVESNFSWSATYNDRSVITGDTANDNIYIKNTLYSDANTFKIAMNGVKLLYELAVPIVTELTPSEIAELLSLKTYNGTTYIDTDGAPFEISYFEQDEIAVVDSKVDGILNKSNGYIQSNNICRGIENGSIDTIGNDQYNIIRARNIGYDEVDGNDYYTVSAETTKQAHIIVYEFASKGTAAIKNSGWQEFPYTFLTDANTRLLRYIIKSGDSDNPEYYISNFQVEKGGKSTSFEPYCKSNTELTKLTDDMVNRGFFSNNLWQINPITIGANSGITYDFPLKKGKYIFKTSSNFGNGNFNFFGVLTSNEALISGGTWGNASRGIPFEATKDYIALRIYSNSTISGNIQIIKQDDDDISYHDYVPSNSELNESLTPQGYITSGLTFNNCSLTGGGYFKIGNLVVINMRLTLTSANPYPTVSGLPIYDGSANFVTFSAYSVSIGISDHTSGWISPQGVMNIVSGSGNSNNVIISAMYLAK